VFDELYSGSIGVAQTWLFEHAVQPVLHAAGLIHLDETAFAATEWFILGLLEIALLYAILRPLEAARPVERWTSRENVRVDVIYTMLGRLGIVPLAFFFLLQPLADAIESSMRMAGFARYNLEDVVPGIAAVPLVAFFVYLVVLDLAEYWRHRFSHRFGWWWALHALHHSQRQMSFWTDNRNHLLDDFTQAVWIAAIALVIGVPPGQFFLAIIAARMLESLSHANARVSFGRLGERVLVSPRFHRIHHAIGLGHEGRFYGCNFAVLFPLWDILFGTANFSDRLEPTGIRDQLDGRDYGRGFWAQQWIGVRDMLRALFRKSHNA
jgi:sterol desaturase/sphingolipid hydroxylase (fatty acid hydroxylase superfamily)